MLESESEQLDASVVFWLLKVLICPLFFCGWAVGGTLSEGTFSWTNGSYGFVFGAWIISYTFWAFFTRVQLAATGYVLDGNASEDEAREALSGFASLNKSQPITWAGRFELLVFGVVFLIGTFVLPEFGLSLLSLTAGHFVFVVVWRTIVARAGSSVIRTEPGGEREPSMARVSKS